MMQFRLRLALQFGNNPLRQLLAKLHAPLVERVDLPDGALGKHAVLVQRHQLAQRFGREPLRQNHVRRPVALKHPMRHQPVRRAFRLHLLGRFSERQRLGLREHIRHQHVVVPPSGFSACEKAMKSHGIRFVPWWISW